MFSATAWVPRGAAAEMPRKADFDEKEMSRIAELAKLELQDAGEHLSAAKGTQANPPSITTNGDDDELKEYNMSDYDDEVEEDRKNTIAGVQGLAYYGPDEPDEYLTLPDAQDIQEEEDELRIYSTDNMLLGAKTEDDVSLLEVYVYDDKEGSLYVHHDIMLPSFPLCLEWLPITPGPDLKPGNFVAIGTFEPEIELWDLDLMDSMFPTAILGKCDRPEARALGTGKKKRKLKVANENYHVDAILSLTSNSTHTNLLASGSADTTIKMWDLNSSNNEKAVRSLHGYHTNKVSSVIWNPAESTVLLSGGYDSYARIGDLRSANIKKDSRAFLITGDVENVQWDKDGIHFYVGSDRGQIYKFDGRQDAKPLWTLQAHDLEITSFAVNNFVNDFLATASSDHLVKLWDLRDGKPTMILSKDFDVGKVFSVSFGPEEATRSLLSVGGSEGKLKVWDAFTNKAIRGAFGGKSGLEAPETTKERIVAANSDSDEEEQSDREVEGDEFDED